jgi:two-component sensor histidine kinase
MATPVGLIINEIITNSLKYAFPEGQDGMIGISLAALKNDEYELLIFDNGIGLPQEIVPDTTNTFGLYLVKMLVEAQLQGSLEIDRTTGTRFIIRFKTAYRKKR